MIEWKGVERVEKKNKSVIEIILKILLYIISIIWGIIFSYFIVKQEGFLILLPYGLAFFIGLKLVITIICSVLNKHYKNEYDKGSKKKFAIIYIVTSVIFSMILVYISTKDIIISILMGVVMSLWVNGLPIFYETVTSDFGYTEIPNNYYSNSTPKAETKFDPGIRTTYFKDEFGNITGNATTYKIGDMEITQFKDKEGRVTGEGTTYGNISTYQRKNS